MPTTLQLVHQVSVGIYLGSTVLLGFLLSSVAREATNAVDRRRRYASVFRVYNPLAIGVLGVIIMTGAWSITGIKERLGPAFFGAFGAALAYKLLFVFLVVMFGVHVSLGIGHRMVRAAQGDTPVTDADLDRQIRRMHQVLWPCVGILIYTMYIGLSMRVPVAP